MLGMSLTNGYKLIWPLFGSTNQLLAALTLIAVTAWLHRAGRKNWFTLIPAIVMIVTTIASLTYCLFNDYLRPPGNTILAVIDILLLGLSFGVIRLSIKKPACPTLKPKSSLSA
jgi:carbon starvation protein